MTADADPAPRLTKNAVATLRPRTIGELLDASFLVYRRYFWRLLIACTLVSLPALVGAALYAESAGDAVKGYFTWVAEYTQKSGKNFDFEQYMTEWWGQFSSLQAFALLSAALQSISRGGGLAVMALATWYVARGDTMPTAWEMTKRVGPRIPAVVLAYFMLSQLVGFVILCPPIGAVFLAIVAPAPVIMITERGRLERRARRKMTTSSGAGRLFLRTTIVPIAMGLDGFVRSLTLSFHGPTIGRGSLYFFFLFLFLSFFVSGLTAAVQVAVSLTGSTSWAPIFWAQQYAEVLILPALGVGTTLWYLDLLVRREGVGLVRGLPSIEEIEATEATVPEDAA